MGALAFGLPESVAADSPPAQEPIDYTLTTPNILIIMVDQLRYLELGSRLPGLSTVLPNITALQAQSVEFTSFNVAATSCTASRACFLTGLYPPQTYMYITQGNGAAPSLNTGFPTFATYLQTLNYLTAYYGKWHLSDESDDYDDTSLQPYGFSINGNEDPSPDGWANEGMTGGTFANPPHQAEDGTWINDQQIVNGFGRGLQLLANSGSPWCAVVSLVNPHDISNYPRYILSYSAVTPLSGIDVYYPPQVPGTAPTWAVNNTEYPALPVNPNLPNIQKLYATSFAEATASPSSGVSSPPLFTSYGTGIATPNAVPSNTTEAQNRMVKPGLQSDYQEAIFSLQGSIDSTDYTAPYTTNAGSASVNGDWGQFLNVYYWITSCADQCIGQLGTADPHLIGTTDPPDVYCTILGQYQALLNYFAAQNETGLQAALENTVIVFTSDHGELGGAHSFIGKSACSYNEVINVPLFVHLPGQTTNNQRTQLLSAVDFFGLIAGLANHSYSGGAPAWKTAYPYLSNRSDMIQCLTTPNYVPMGRQVTINGTPEPYILHTYNEWFESAFTMTPWASDDPYHVLCVNTPVAKLVYYDKWDTSGASPQSSFNTTPSSSEFNTQLSSYTQNWAKNNAEYYTSPQETGNGFVASTTDDLQSAVLGILTNELQASLAGYSSLVTAQSAAQTDYVNYISPPTNLQITNGPFTQNTEAQPISFMGDNVQPGPTVVVEGPGLPSDGQRFDLDDTDMSPYSVSVVLGDPSTYSLTVQNPCGLSETINFTVSA